MSQITRSPLCWPAWSARTKEDDRRSANFSKQGEKKWEKKSLSIADARARVTSQLSMFTKAGRSFRCHPDSVIISSDLELRLDGMPRSDRKKPADPGVAVYFVLDDVQRCIPCDTYTRIEDNMAAVAATIEALRAIERHGSQMFETAFSGFDALPAPDHVVGRNWRDVLDYYGDDIFEAQLEYQRMRKATHPDITKADSADEFNAVQAAWEQAKLELNNGLAP